MGIGVRLATIEGGPEKTAIASHVDVVWRRVQSLEHGDLCRAFNLDPVRHRFDLPRSSKPGEGSAYASRGTRVSGFLERFERGEWRPIGKLHVVREGERFRDLDPLDNRDNFSLDETR